MENKPEGKVLGKQVSYPKTYAPEILVAVPRYENRAHYHISESDLPFIGFDTWHAYEAGFLTQQGLPVSGLLKMVYPSNSPFLVESKSLKLYLNSFNHEALGDSRTNAIHAFLVKVEHDLSALLQTNVALHFFEQETAETPFDFEGFSRLEDAPFAENLQFTCNKEAPEVLQISTENKGEIMVYSDLLRSNCKITNQPDWGSIFIHLKGNKPPDPASLLRYIVSFRNENHFHEEVCEMMYKRLNDYYAPSELMVACLYTRRGGIDICPVRCSSETLYPRGLNNVRSLTPKTLRQ